MSLWSLTDDDFEAIEAERLDQQRPEEERQLERELLEQRDMDGEIEDQDILARLHQESLEADPAYLLYLKDRQEAYDRFEAEQEAAERVFGDGLSLNTDFPYPMTPTNSMLRTPQDSPMQPQRLIPNGKPQEPTPQALKKPETSAQKSPKEKPKKLTPRDVANVFCTAEDIVITGNAMYWFDEIIYRLMAKEDMRRLIVEKCRSAVEQIGTSGFVEDVFRCVFDEPRICQRDIQPSPDELVFLDGVLNLKTGSFTKHSPKIFATSYLTVNYRNGLTTSCPRFDNFVATISNGNPVLERRIWEMLGYIFTQDQRGKVFFVLQGPSDSGKSILGNFVRKCFNKEAVSSLELHSLGKDFSKSDLIGRRLCLDLDLPAGPINVNAVNNLKKLTGSDPVTTNVKYMPYVSFLNTAKFLYATNHALYYEYTDGAFERRIVVIPFTKVIPQSEQNFDLLSQLEQEKDAVAVKALSFYYELRERHYIFSGDFTINATVSGGVNLPDLVAQFFNESCMEADVWTSTSEFYEEFCRQHGMMCAMNTFSEVLYLIAKGAYPSVEKKRGRINGQGNPVGGYLGLALRTNDNSKTPTA